MILNKKLIMKDNINDNKKMIIKLHYRKIYYI